MQIKCYNEVILWLTYCMHNRWLVPTTFVEKYFSSPRCAIRSFLQASLTCRIDIHFFALSEQHKIQTTFQRKNQTNERPMAHDNTVFFWFQNNDKRFLFRQVTITPPLPEPMCGMPCYDVELYGL